MSWILIWQLHSVRSNWILSSELIELGVWRRTSFITSWHIQRPCVENGQRRLDNVLNTGLKTSHQGCQCSVVKMNLIPLCLCLTCSLWLGWCSVGAVHCLQGKGIYLSWHTKRFNNDSHTQERLCERWTESPLLLYIFTISNQLATAIASMQSRQVFDLTPTVGMELPFTFDLCKSIPANIGRE